jgi:hypothetical protein
MRNNKRKRGRRKDCGYLFRKTVMEVVIAETTNNYPQEGMQKSVEALTGGGRMRRSNTKKFWQFSCNGTFERNLLTETTKSPNIRKEIGKQKEKP